MTNPTAPDSLPLTAEQEPTYTKPVYVHPDAVMMVPDRLADPHIVWQLTWGGEPSKRCRVVAASIISSYEYLLSPNISTTEAINRLRTLRQTYKAAGHV